MKILPANRLNNVQEYYFSKKLKEIAQLRESGIKIINLGIGSPDLAPDEKTVVKLSEEILKTDNHAYQSYIGIDALRNSFADFYNEYFSVALNPTDEILPLMGSKEGVMHISMAFLNSGDEVLVPNPGYPTYEAVTNLLDAKTVLYKLDENNNWAPNFEELEKRDLSKVKIMWTNYPNMPTGAKATKELLQQLVDFGLKHNILIVNDNPYSFILNDEPLSIMGAENAKDIAMELNSLSKSHNMSGWRVGMLVGHATYINNVLKVKSNMDSGMFKPVQLAAVEALKNGREWFASLNAIYASRRDIVFKMLDILKFEYSTQQAGLFVWAKISSEFESAEQFSDLFLEKEKVFITPGSIFGDAGEKFVRVSLCTSEDILNEVLLNAASFVKQSAITN